MKKLLLCVLWLCAWTHIQAQYSETAQNLMNRMYYVDSTSNYFDLARDANAYIDTTTLGDKDRFMKRWGRYSYYWSSRVDASGSYRGVRNFLNTVFDQPICKTGGAGWHHVSHTGLATSHMGIITALYVLPSNPQIIWAGSNFGGLFKTIDGGQHWFCITDGADRFPAMGVQSIAVDPQDTSIIYIATCYNTEFYQSYGAGIYKTTNGGQSWQQEALPNRTIWSGIVNKIMYHPADPNVIYAVGKGCIYVKQNGTWIQTGQNLVLQHLGYNSLTNAVSVYDNSINSDIEYIDIEVHPTDPNIIYASSRGVRDLELRGTYQIGYFATVVMSTDKGQTWQYIPAALQAEINSYAPSRIVLSVSPNSPDYPIRFALAARVATPLITRFYKCTKLLDNHLPAYSNISSPDFNFYKGTFDVNRVDSTIFYMGDVSFRKYGSTGTINMHGSPTPHADIRACALYTSTQGGVNDVVYIGTDGGVTKIKNDTTTDIHGEGLAVTQYFDIGCSSIKKGLLIGGAQDNSTFSNALGVWTHMSGGDGGGSLIHPDNPNYALGRANYLVNIYKNLLTSTSWININLSAANEFWIHRYYLNEQNYNTVYAPRETKLNRLRNVWTNAVNDTVPVAPAGNYIEGFAVAPSDSMRMYCSKLYQADSAAVLRYKLYRSDNEGNTWTDITNNLRIIEHAPVKCLAVHPTNPDIVWAGLASFDVAGYQRVYQSLDGGNSWHEYDPVGLPKYPVNKLLIQRNTSAADTVIYAATDVGVFRLNSVSRTWECLNKDLPMILISDLEIDYCSQKLYAATFGRGIYVTDLPTTRALEITQNTTWSAYQYKHIATDIIIRAGATLTVQGVVNMGKNTKITVEPNAQLIVDGGTLTNLCDETWQGIVVVGTRNQRQSNSYQGRVVCNNATIAYAKEAISLWKDNNLQTAGGVVEATNTTFLNNWRSVEMVSYHNTDPIYTTREIANRSFFTYCKFIVDSSYRAFSSSRPFNAHVSMWDVFGVNFLECEFAFNNTNTTLFATTEQRGRGIFSLGANYTLSKRQTATANSMISGFYRGIDAGSAGNALSPNITNTIFTNNYQGVYGAAAPQLRVQKNQFTIGGFGLASPTTSNTHTGVALVGTPTFTIQNNTFVAASLNPLAANTIGTHVDNTGGTSNKIYRNVYNLQYGNTAMGTNQNMADYRFGLEYHCNQQYNSIADEFVYGNATIAQNQGSATLAAGNTFATNTTVNLHNLNARNHLNYFYYNTAAEYPNTVLNVQRIATRDSITCPDKTVSRDTVWLPNRQANIYRTKFLRNKYRDSLAIRIDNGNTAYHLSLAQQATNSTASSVLLTLAKPTPFVSDAVALAVIQNPAFTPARVVELLTQNPDVLLNADILDALVGRVEPAQHEALLALQGTYTERTRLVSVCGYWESTLQEDINTMLDILEQDTIVDMDTIGYYIHEKGTLEAAYQYAEWLWAKGQYSMALAHLNTIPQLFVLHSSQQTAYSRFVALKQALYQAHTQGRELYQLNATEQNQLHQWATGNDWAAYQAQSILNFFYEGIYGYAITLPDTEEIAERRSQSSTQTILSPMLHLVPNPTTSGMVQIEYDLLNQQQAVLSVLTPMGNVVYSQSLYQSKGLITVDLAHLPAGAYYISIRPETGKPLTELLIKK